MRKLRHLPRWLLVCGLLCAPLCAARAEKLPVRIYTSADGLGSGFVDALMRDTRGFMWFCTRDGLSRFDGAQFVTYQIGDEAAPAGVEAFYETRDGIYWIGTTRGLYRFDPAALSAPKVAKNGRPILNAEFVSQMRGNMFEDRDGTIWMAADGLYRLEQNAGQVTFQRIELNLPPEFNQDYGLANIQQTAEGSLWFNTTFGTVRRLPDGRVIFYPFQFSLTETLLDIAVDEAGRVWVVRGMELFVIRPEPLEALAGLAGTTVRDLAPSRVVTLETDAATPLPLPNKQGEVTQIVSQDYFGDWKLRSIYVTRDGHVWLTTLNGLFEFDGRAFHHYSSDQGLINSMVRMAEDTAGNLWFGGRAGVARLDRRGLTTYGPPDGLSSAETFAINVSRDGTLYVANGSLAVSEYDGRGFRTVQVSAPQNARSLWTSRYAFLDSRGEWWVATTEGLLRFTGGFDALGREASRVAYTTRDGLPSNFAFQVFEDKRGDIWVSARGSHAGERGLSRWSRAANSFHTFTDRESFPTGKSASSFAEDGSGGLWFGFYEGGLARYKDGRFTLFAEESGLPAGVITDLHVDRAGRLWIASVLGGLLRVDDPSAERPQFVSYTTGEGLSSNNVRTMTEDLLGNIYAGTVRGVDRLSPETGRVKHFSVSDGLGSDFVVDSLCDRGGTVWFATTRGLSRLTPATDAKPSPPIVWLGGLSVSGLAQPVSELGTPQAGNLELSYSQNNVKLDFFGLDLRPGETLRYQYMLIGADRDWSAPSEQRTVTYANLQPGSYQFLVRGVNTDGDVSVRPASVGFKILPPVWRRWWFVTLVVLVFGSVAFVFVHSRVARRRAAGAAREERLRDLERVRKHIATDLHDDIGSSLTQISILSEVVLQQLKATNGSATQALTQIAGASRELVDTMSDIVWAVNPQKDRFEDLIQRMRRFASEVLEARNIELDFDAPENAKFTLGANVRREILLIFKECVNNIVKHSGCTKVSVEVSRRPDQLTLLVADNGRGFDTSLDSEGHGLVSMRDRARALGGSLKLDSSVGTGTTLTLEVPLSFQSKGEKILN